MPVPNSVIAKSILNKTKRRDPWFLDEYTINPYSGCSFNCLYCYIRGSKYGLNMEDKLSVKSNAIELLEKQLSLRAKKNQYGIIVLSSATDPYLHFEKDLGLTRKILEVILKHRFPVHVITKSNLVVGDLDILHKINSAAILPPDLEGKLPAKVFITFSFSTVDDAVGKIFEPGAPPPSKRLIALQTVSGQGFYAGVSMMPLLPFISDTRESLEKMFSDFKDHWAKYVMPASISLFGNGEADSKTLILRAIAKHFPHLEEKYVKWFSNSGVMPEYYQVAFSKKMNELSQKYNLPDRIARL
ncbi:MAG: radical SAM protein [Bacteroidia bacterium]|nr:radical SAM protein [Bacteroidia bacterium]